MDSSVTFLALSRTSKRFSLSDSASMRISGSAIPPTIAPRQSATISFAECSVASGISISADFPMKLANFVTVLSIFVPYRVCLNSSCKQ